jgi:hypothetical protein
VAYHFVQICMDILEIWNGNRWAGAWLAFAAARLATATRPFSWVSPVRRHLTSRAKVEVEGWCGSAVKMSALAADSTRSRHPDEPVGVEPIGNPMPIAGNKKSLRYLYGEPISPYRNFMERRRTMVA